MTFFRAVLGMCTLVIWVYTFVVMGQYGPNFLPTLIKDVQALAWAGQFDVDFLIYLNLLGFWVAWREKFSAKGIFWGLLTAWGGFFVFGPYLLWLTFKSQGEPVELLIGKARQKV